MRMRVISKKALSAFCEKHPELKQTLCAWHAETSKAIWLTPNDIQAQYPSASFVGENRVAFNLKGKAYRLVVAVAYRVGVVYIKFIGTHDEYDESDVASVEGE